MRLETVFKLAAWGLVGAVAFVTVSPIELRPPTETTVDLDRALAFAATGGAFALAYPRQWWVVLMLLPAAAFGIEALQFLSPTRHAHLSDAAVKAIGAIGGVLVGRLAAGWADAVARRLRLAD